MPSLWRLAPRSIRNLPIAASLLTPSLLNILNLDVFHRRRENAPVPTLAFALYENEAHWVHSDYKVEMPGEETHEVDEIFTGCGLTVEQAFKIVDGLKRRSSGAVIS